MNCEDDRTNFSDGGGGAFKEKRKHQGRIQASKRQRCAGGLSTEHSPIKDDNSWLLHSRGSHNYPSSSSSVASRMLAAGQFVDAIQRSPVMLNLVSEMMIRDPTNVRLQLSGLRFLSECCGQFQNVETYLLCITRTMKCYQDTLVLQLEGLFSLRRRLRTLEKDEVCRSVGDTDILDAVTNAMHRHAHSCRELCFLGLDIIRIFVTGSEMLRKLVAGKEAIMDILLALIEARSEDALLMPVALSVLSWIVEEREGRDTTAERGGVLLALNAMNAHPEDLLVQCNAAACLCWLIHTNNPNARATLAEDSSGIMSVKDSLKKYADSPSIFGNLLCVLIGAQIADPSRRDFQNQEIVTLSVMGMERHKDSPKVRRNCLTLLRLLTIDNPTCQEMVINYIDRVQSIMQQNLEDLETQTEACGVLTNISMLPGGFSKVSKLGCIETVVSSQLRHRSCMRFQQVAALFHSMLSAQFTREEGVSAFGGTNVFEPMFTETGLLPEIRRG